MAWMEDSGGVYWKCGWFLYAQWLLESATILRWAGMEREVRSAMVLSW